MIFLGLDFLLGRITGVFSFQCQLVRHIDSSHELFEEVAVKSYMTITYFIPLAEGISTGPDL